MPTSPITTQRLTIDGLSIRYAASEPRDPPAVLLSPWPESLYAFEPVWADLASAAHLVAVDLPGFGRSDGRADLFSPRAMAGFLIRLLDAFQLDKVHAVGPDIATSAVLFAASSRPDRFQTLVVGSGAASYPLELGEPLSSWVGTNDLDDYRNLDPREIVASTIARINPSYTTPDRIRADYLDAYDGRRFLESMQYVRSYPTELAVLRDVLPAIQTPVEIIAGSRDSAVPPTNARFLHDRLPVSKLDSVDAGHFVWEQDPATYASLVLDWWKRPRS